MRYLAAIVGLWFGIILGLSLPDFDQRLPFLTHRSIITHSCFIPLLFVLFSSEKRVIPRLFAIGLLGGVAIHLACDMFPTQWTGFALIKIPSMSPLSPFASQAWILGNGLICIFVALALMDSSSDIVISMVSIAVHAVVYARYEMGLWNGLLVFLLMTGLALAIASRTVPMWRWRLARR
jgi:membrane-bound metal-dependent hydrolase YbcI (DUF457 family)